MNRNKEERKFFDDEDIYNLKNLTFRESIIYLIKLRKENLI